MHIDYVPESNVCSGKLSGWCFEPAQKHTHKATNTYIAVLSMFEAYMYYQNTFECSKPKSIAQRNISELHHVIQHPSNGILHLFV